MATARKSSAKKTTKAGTSQVKRVSAAESRERARQYSTGVRLGIISLTMLAFAFLLLVLTKYQ